MITFSVDASGIEELVQIVNHEFMPSREKMYRVGEAIINIVKANFLAGGRPEKWPARKDGSTSMLMKSGKLVNSLHISALDEAMVEVRPGNLPYAGIHNFGGVINHPGSQKMQAFEVGGQLIVTHGTKPHKIPIPQRKYLTIPPDERQTLVRAYTAS